MSHQTISQSWNRFRPALMFAVALLAAGGLGALTGCEQDEEVGEARAYQTTDREQLIGGPGALGEVGDYVIENDQIRVVIQDLTFNRGTGIFGGSVIDADLVRQDGQGDPFGGNGHDTFGEMFPMFLAEVIDPNEIVIVDAQDLDRDDISDNAAVLEVRGDGGEFVTMARFFNQAMISAYDPVEQFQDRLSDGKLPHSDGEPLVEFTARYILEPGDRHLRIETEMTNVDDGTLTFPNQDIMAMIEPLIGQFFGSDDDEDDDDNGDDPLDDVTFEDFRVPTGAAVGVGAFNSLFMPDFGFDIRYGLEENFAEYPIRLPAVPGHPIDVMASASDQGVSYGFATAADADTNFIHQQGEYYEERFDGEVPDNHLLFVFDAAGYGATFTHAVPEELESGESFRATNYFVVGSGDVASIRDEVYQLHDIDTHTVSGRMVDETTGQAVGEGAEIFFYEAASDGSCSEANGDAPVIFNHAHTRAEGYFEAQIPPGDYCYRTRHRGDTSGMVAFSVDDGPVLLNTSAPGHGRVEAFITDQSDNPIPAKMTIVGEFEPHPDKAPREHLFEQEVGERWRTAESVDLNPEESAEFIETIEFSSADGRAGVDVRPGEYTAYFSRGSEYDLVARDIEVTPANTTRMNVQLERQINPDGYLSGDYHMHAEGSIDSSLDYNDRVVSIAGEGVEVVVATDHNYVSDYMPYIHRNDLQRFLRSVVGVELTTMEAGHFNAFPLQQDLASQNRGSIAWQNRSPGEIFDELREHGSLGPDDTIIQINHPRDGILGYFTQHNVNPLTGEAVLPINETDDGIQQAIAGATSGSGPAFAEQYTDEDGETAYRSAFSYDFDAIELFNGKRMHLLHHFRMPYDKDEIPDDAREGLSDEEYESLPEQAGVILCDGDEVAYPGALDDWYNFLNYRFDGEYRKYTGTANSDSHHYGSPDDSEPGFPKNYFYAGHNDPQNATPEQLSQALQDHHNIATNGPFINMSIDGEPIGSTVPVDDGTVTLDLEIQASDWVIGDDGFTYDIVANGERIVEGARVEAEDFEDHRWEGSHDIDLDDHSHLHHADEEVRDTWFVLEVHGENNLFPVVQPAEIPQIPFEEALGELAEPFGIGATADDFAPSEVTDIHPFAFTNPIWVVDDAQGEERDEFIPPEPPYAECVEDQFQANQLQSADDFMPFGDRRLDAQSTELHFHNHDDIGILQSDPDELRDVRTIFNHWHDH